MIVDIEKLSVDYSGIKALDGISFGIDDGDFLGIIGPNGAGKSTLFRCMLGLHVQYNGTIRFFGQDIRDSRKHLSQIGFVPQKPVIDKNFPATVREIVSTSQNSNDSKKVDEVLQKVWMHELADRRIGDLSIGQQQRIFIAKALVNSPRILILDEPVIGLDVYNQDLRNIQRLLCRCICITIDVK